MHVPPGDDAMEREAETGVGPPQARPGLVAPRRRDDRLPAAGYGAQGHGGDGGGGGCGPGDEKRLRWLPLWRLVWRCQGVAVVVRLWYM